MGPALSQLSLGSLPYFRFNPKDAEVNVFKPAGNAPEVRLWLYDNYAEYVKFYNKYDKFESAANEIIGDYAAGTFSNFREMMDAFDGFTITFEADFKDRSVG